MYLCINIYEYKVGLTPASNFPYLNEVGNYHGFAFPIWDAAEGVKFVYLSSSMDNAESK